MAYLVPFDFTPEAETALDHAICLSDVTQRAIVLLHIVKHHYQVKKVEHRLEVFRSTLSPGLRKRISFRIVRGSVLQDIGKMSDLLNAKLVVMGSHDRSGLRRFLPGNVISVLRNAAVPFILTNGAAPPDSGYKNIVFPLNHTDETMNILVLVAEVAKIFKSKVFLLCESQKDELQTSAMTKNVLAAAKILNGLGIDNEADVSSSERSFILEILSYAKAKNADLLIAGYFSDGVLPQFDSFIQGLLTKKHGIPMLTANLRELAGRSKTQNL